MSDDPVQWKDDADAPPRLRQLLRARTELPPMPPETRVAILAELTDKAIVPHTPRGTALEKVLGSKVGAVAALTGMAAIVAAIAWGQRSSAVSVPIVAPIPTAFAPASATVPVEPTAPLSPSAPADGTPIVAPPTASPPPARSLTSVRPTLANESALIGRARSEVASDPSSSLAAIDEHARKFPQGELTPEREYLRISALHRLGRDGEARTRGRAYLVRFASSPYAPVVRKLLVELEPR